ncbi:hypothetical protein CVT24_000611 [Panaeolus cyanescens]|uniref:Uncharacterized protein n=1 Tax=Panaeolus cyanescens TaxID=181874 RepID=A0A409WPF8_9AGAR|nr:hypothetical protein CVT24_000611 [Panaeolus cyanescens]
MSGVPFTDPPTRNENQTLDPTPDPFLTAHYDQLLFQKLHECDQAHQSDLAAWEAAWERHQQEMRARKMAMEAEIRAREAAMAAEMHLLSAQLMELRATSEAPTGTPQPAGDNAPRTPPCRQSTHIQTQTPSRQKSSTTTTSIPVTPHRGLARTPSANAASPATGVGAKTSTPQKKPAVKAASQTSCMLQSELPDDALGLKKAMIMHIHLLLGWTRASDVPSDPSQQVLADFQSKISDKNDLEAHHQSSPVFPPSLVQIRQTLAVGNRSNILRFLSTISDPILKYIQTCLAKFGVICWCPNLRQSANSLYNSACRIIAIDTFKQVLVAHAYNGLQPNKTYVMKMDILVKIYNHFVHHYMNERYKKNARDPRSVQSADKASPVYRNCVWLAEACCVFLSENGYPQQYIEMIDTKATSDDKADPAGLKEKGWPVHWIKKCPERSWEADIFFRHLEETIERMAKLEGKHIRGRLRKILEMDQKESDFLTLPQGMPIDYFDPSFFNSLQPRIRSRCTSQKIALLPNINLSFTHCEDEFISDDEFKDKYQDVALRYKLNDLVDFGNDNEDFIDDNDDMMDCYYFLFSKHGHSRTVVA